MAAKVETSCFVCGAPQAPFGFHGRHTCRDHRAAGEKLVAATQDGHSGGWVRGDLPADDSRALGPRQGRLI